MEVNQKIDHLTGLKLLRNLTIENNIELWVSFTIYKKYDYKGDLLLFYEKLLTTKRGISDPTTLPSPHTWTSQSSDKL